MNRNWLIPFVVALVTGVAAYGVTRHVACGQAAPSVDRLQDVGFLTRELGLNEAQARQIKSLHTTLGEELDKSCRQHCGARRRLAQALAADTNGTAQADAVLGEMCRAYEQSERATLEHILAVRRVLSPEQAKRFDALLSNCMCQPCSMHDGRCGADTTGNTRMEPSKGQEGKVCE